MIKLPYARADFGAMRRDQCYYVDRTPFLEQFETYAPLYPVFASPTVWEIVVYQHFRALLRPKQGCRFWDFFWKITCGSASLPRFQRPNLLGFCLVFVDKECYQILPYQPTAS
jgi:hypothetical protein